MASPDTLTVQLGRGGISREQIELRVTQNEVCSTTTLLITSYTVNRLIAQGLQQ